jgi:hypothetical protein
MGTIEQRQRHLGDKLIDTIKRLGETETAFAHKIGLETRKAFNSSKSGQIDIWKILESSSEEYGSYRITMYDFKVIESSIKALDNLKTQEGIDARYKNESIPLDHAREVPIKPIRQGASIYTAPEPAKAKPIEDVDKFIDEAYASLRKGSADTKRTTLEAKQTFTGKASAITLESKNPFENSSPKVKDTNKKPKLEAYFPPSIENGSTVPHFISGLDLTRPQSPIKPAEAKGKLSKLKKRIFGK